MIFFALSRQSDEPPKIDVSRTGLSTFAGIISITLVLGILAN